MLSPCCYCINSINFIYCNYLPLMTILWNFVMTLCILRKSEMSYRITIFWVGLIKFRSIVYAPVDPKSCISEGRNSCRPGASTALVPALTYSFLTNKCFAWSSFHKLHRHCISVFWNNFGADMMYPPDWRVPHGFVRENKWSKCKLYHVFLIFAYIIHRHLNVVCWYVCSY